jgi:hypothetical protein
MSEPSPRYIVNDIFKPLLNPHDCECGNSIWNVEIMEDVERTIGVLLKCTDCGYIETVWRDE